MPSTQVERPTAAARSAAERGESDQPDGGWSVADVPGDGPADGCVDLSACDAVNAPIDRSEGTDHHRSPRRRSSQGSDLPLIAIRLMLGVGRALMIIGILLLLFAAFQLWGTGLSEGRAQADLTDRFLQQLAEREDALLEDAATVGPIEDSTAAAGAQTPAEKPEPLVVSVPDDAAAAHNRLAEQQRAAEQQAALERSQRERQLAAVALGDPIGVLRIPAIDLEKTIAEGTTRDVLRSGPGHYPSTPRPGQQGNVAIAGHRTTHGAPFLDIDQLAPGDEITVETVDGTFTYAVEGQTGADGNVVGHLIVRPEDVEVIMDQGDDRLTLTACHPKYSARQRIIVTAVLVSAPPVPLPEQATPPETIALPEAQPTLRAGVTPPAEPAVPLAATDESPTATDGPLTVTDREAPAFDDAAGSESLGWQAQYATPTALWAALTALIALAGWLVGRAWRRVPAYAMAAPSLILSLYYCFVNLERFIPAV